MEMSERKEKRGKKRKLWLTIGCNVYIGMLLVLMKVLICVCVCVQIISIENKLIIICTRYVCADISSSSPSLAALQPYRAVLGVFVCVKSWPK